MADAGGTVSLSHLAATSGLPLPTIHRLVRTLAGRGYVRQQSSREYALGPRLVQLGDTAGRLVGLWVRPKLAELVEELGETANMALLEGTQVVYVAQAPGRHSMRMFTEVGRRVSPHCTAVGKALLARAEPERVRGDPAQHGHGGAHREHVHRRGRVTGRAGSGPCGRLRDRRGRAGARRAVRGGRARRCDPGRHVDLGPDDADDRRARWRRPCRACTRPPRRWWTSWPGGTPSRPEQTSPARPPAPPGPATGCAGRMGHSCATSVRRSRSFGGEGSGHAGRRTRITSPGRGRTRGRGRAVSSRRTVPSMSP